MKARAKTLNGDVVEGYSIYDLHMYSTINVAKTGVLEMIQISTIDPTTLEYQIGGKWYSMKELERRLDDN